MINLRNSVIYSIYVRNHSKEGSFKAVVNDLDRIKDLGVDFIWLMPIHQIGKENKKGHLGCPYAVEDYRSINSEYGTLDDFKELLNQAHNRGLKVIIDVVYNHTAYNSKLYKEHPEWFYKKENNHAGNKVGEWSDVIDLDYNNKELWKYQIDTLKYWVSVGVDGFRCDVAPLVPIDFWQRAREEVKEIKEDIVWVSESVHPRFVKEVRNSGFSCSSDSEIYEAFDIAYDYDTYEFLELYLHGKCTLKEYIEKKRAQEYIYPGNYVKLRFVENHDNPRAAKLFPWEYTLKNWTAFAFFEKGTALIYAGEEVRDTNTPSLFNKDMVNWRKDSEFTEFIKALVRFKRNEELLEDGIYDVSSKVLGVIEGEYTKADRKLFGIFNVESKIGNYKINLKDGTYTNKVNGKEIKVVNGAVDLSDCPLIISA